MKLFDKVVLFLVFFLYSLFSSPIPSTIGLVEVAIGILLIILVSRGLIYIIPGFHTPIQLILAAIWMIFVPTIIGLIFKGHDVKDYIRDFFPLMFLLVPLFLYPRISYDPHNWLKYINLMLLISGFTLSVRYILNGGGNIFEDVLHSDTAPINQCPSVIYACTASIIMAANAQANYIYRIIYVMIFLTCLTGLMMAVMRAQIAITIIVGIYGFLYSILSSTKKNVVTCMVIIATMGLLNFEVIINSITWTYEMAKSKTEVAGLLNNRDAEFYAVINYISEDVWLFLLGDGWGGKIYLETASKVVRYTHNSILFIIWKLGVLGAIVVLVYFVYATGIDKIRYLKIENKDNYFHVLLGVIASLCIFCILEMGYKMLSFGMVLTILQSLLKINYEKDN